MVRVGVIAPSVSRSLLSSPAICRRRRARRHRGSDLSRSSSTHHQRVCVVDKHLVSIQHIVRRGHAGSSSDLWRLCHYYVYLTLSNFFPVFLVQTIIRERDDPRFVHESFPGPRGRPSALHVPACMGDGALH